MASFAPRGGMSVSLNAGGTGTLSLIDVVAPGTLQGDFLTSGTHPQRGYDLPGYIWGSSVAAPVVSGIAGLVRNGIWWAWGTCAWETGAIMANVILLGDGWWGTNSTTPTSRMDVVSGAGRVRAHWPSSSDLVAPWAWGWHKYTISAGQDVTWAVGSGGPMSSAVTQYKAAFVMMPSSLSSIPDIDFYLEDTCPAGAALSLLRRIRDTISGHVSGFRRALLRESACGFEHMDLAEPLRFGRRTICTPGHPRIIEREER